MNPQFSAIGTEFVKQYYMLFDTPAERPKLAALYQPDSMMTFENSQQQGADAILAKINSLPFKSIQHILTTVDCQPSSDGSVMVVVIGQLKTDEDPPHSFSQFFCLRPTPQGTWYISNEFFRLTLHNG